MFVQPGDTITGNWTYLQPMANALYGVNSVYIDSVGGVYFNKIFVCGGADSASFPKRVCRLYNPVTNQYEPADSLPIARALGTLVRVKDSLYLIASIGTDFNSPDGAIFKYDIMLDYWQEQTPMPVPAVIESAVFPWKDTLIVVVGGSTSGFSYPTDLIRIYNTYTNTWSVSTVPFYRPTTCSAAACSGNNILIVGGLNGSGVIYDDVIRGTDTSSFFEYALWDVIGNVPYPGPVYRASGFQYWGNLIFGPALSYDTAFVNYNQFWTYNFNDSLWHRFMPNTIDTLGGISGFAIQPNSDSTYLYLFGGFDDHLSALNKAERFAFANINPIGIHKNTNNIPASFKLFQNYPNPFNPSTIIRFNVPSTGKLHSLVKLVVYDILGREVATLLNENKVPGEYSVEFNASNLASGVYIYRLQAGDFVSAKKMVLIK